MVTKRDEEGDKVEVKRKGSKETKRSFVSCLVKDGQNKAAREDEEERLSQ